MTIRQSLLIAFLLFSVVFTASITALAYYRARDALSAEIRQTLSIQAATLTEQIEATLFERINDLQEWRRLDLMQDLKVGDVDKRLSRFLSDIRTAYHGIYRDIVGVSDSTIVAASDAALIGRPVPPAPAWQRLDLPDGAVSLSHPDTFRDEPEMAVGSELRDAFSGAPLGRLVAYFNWNEITRLLNRATTASGRHALVLDQNRRVIAVSDGLGDRIGQDDSAFGKWPLDGENGGVFTVDDETLGFDELLVGFARTTGYRGLPQLGWSVVVITPVETAFGAIHDLLIALCAFLIGCVIIAALLATKLSARTARPIQQLTAYTRDIGEDIDTPPRHVRGSREIEELNAAFNRMIEDLRTSRERLVRVSKLAAVGEMAAKLAHEVRTPLGIIRSSAQLLDRQEELEPRGHEMMNFMIMECDRINELVTGLLESARPRLPIFESHDINAIVAHVAALLAGKLEQKDITLELPPDDVTLPLTCDRDHLIQILLNLLMNAIQMLGPGGRIRVSTALKGGEVELKVEDDGPGIRPENRESVLEPLVSDRPGGIGLGLSIVREIVTMHSGTLVVDDSELGGACFIIRLPQEHTEKTDVTP